MDRLQHAQHAFLLSIADTIPVLGPLLSDPQFRWWLLGIYLAIGPVPEDVLSKQTGEVTGTRWRWGGLLRVLLIAATGHSKLADRVGSLELAVDHISAGMGAVVAELRAWRGAFERAGIAGPARPADGVSIPPPPASAVAAVGGDEVIPQPRRSVPSRTQL